jgi:hypothetical protein
MLFDKVLTDQDSCVEPSVRHTQLKAIMSDFRYAFPDLTFQVELGFRFVNAQAVVIGDEKCVKLYGGLALHKALGEDALTFIFLHEAGHHLSTGARLPFCSSLACECASDSWAGTQGATRLRRRAGRTFDTRQAICELSNLIPKVRSDKKRWLRIGSQCWQHNWDDRQRALLTTAASPKRCRL